MAGLALTYALLAGLRTIQDFDLGWQLATGRWILQHHQIPSQDVLSYTAHGQPWIYPVASQVAFYLVHLVGGYSLLSWLGALTCMGTVGLLIWRAGTVSTVLALVAVPLVANRTQPRADMFTTLLFAAFVGVLWRYYRREDAHLWLLPVLMVAWVNLHLGFAAGAALCVGYVVLELLHLPFGAGRRESVAHMKNAWPWLAAALLATLLNPWGPYIWSAVVRQEKAQQLHSAWLLEWGNIRPTWTSLQQALDWRDPQSAFWWLLAVAVVACIAALVLRRLGAAVWLGVAAFLTVQHVRFQALFVCVVVVVGGSVLEEAWEGLLQLKTQGARKRWEPAAAVAVIALGALLAGVRCCDLVSNRYYLRSSELAVFGTGLSSWFPERAAAFAEREHLPANLFNSYSLGGYLTWRLGPDYLDYIDGRAVPFGPQLFFRSYNLTVQAPESAVWKQEAEERGINTVMVSLAATSGVSAFPPLQAFCKSQAWSPVYLDEVSAVFVRRTGNNAALADRLQLDCDKVSFDPPQAPVNAPSMRRRAELFRFLVNAAGVLHALGRDPEAIAYTDRALTIFSDNANLHLIRALALEDDGRNQEAEQEFLASLRLAPTDEGWFDLGLLYMTQQRYADATEIFRRSAQASPRAHDMWMMLGQAQLLLRKPEDALNDFDRAVAASPFAGGGEELGARFDSLIATGRAKAWYQLGDLAKAVAFQEQAVSAAPTDAKLWLGLADLYQAQGRATEAEHARRRASEVDQ